MYLSELADAAYEKAYDIHYESALTTEIVEFRDSIPKDDQDDLLLNLLDIIGKNSHPMKQAIELKKYLSVHIHNYADDLASSAQGHVYDREAA